MAKSELEINIVENHLSPIESIYRDVLFETSNYLAKRGIYFNSIVEFIKNPVGYPGDIRKFKLIVLKILDEAISERYFDLISSNLTIKFALHQVMNKIFSNRGGNH